MTISKSGVVITSLEAWERQAPPKRSNQWTDERSAKELARAWLESRGMSLPGEVASALAAHPAFGRVESWHAEPEARLRFDDFAGEPRNTDLLVCAEGVQGQFVMAVEGKADEPFGETVAVALAAALERRLKNERSNGLTRIEQLATALLGPPQEGEPPLRDLRYQLLTASAGVLCEAERRTCRKALLLVHEFVTWKTTDERLARNAADLNAFIRRLSRGTVGSLTSGEICGPLAVPAAGLVASAVSLFVGKVSRNLRA